jgi:hypothetical protein
MKIPINSTFTKEISKKFKRIFNPQTTFEEIQNLQEESYMGSHVDNFLKEVLKRKTTMDKKLPKLQEQYDKFITREQDLLRKLLVIKERKKVVAWKLHQVKYHQATI